MTETDYLALAERFIAERFPGAEIAILAGSTARGERTTTSDIDLLLIGDRLLSDGAASHAATHAFEGEAFEVFAYSREGFAEWAQRSIAGHRPTVVHMLVEGVPLRRSDDLDAFRSVWAARLDAGPDVTSTELAFRRYQLTDVIDDLRDADDPLERHLLATLTFEKTAELMLITAGDWIGAGKQLPRRLRRLDAARADALAAPLLADQFDLLADAAERELERAGGRLREGFVR